MFGLTFEKLLVVTIIAGVVIGPRRLPIYAAQLATFVRELRRFIESTRARAETELGVPLRTPDLRHYDPRRIVRDAFDEPASASAEPVQWTVAGGTSGHPRRVLVPDPAAPAVDAPLDLEDLLADAD